MLDIDYHRFVVVPLNPCTGKASKSPMLKQLLTFLVFSTLTMPAMAQENLGTTFGIPNGAPAVFWPKGMSRESLSPSNLYPNGPEFGLSNSSGGFGMIGSGRMSGVGLARRAVSGLVAEELRKSSASDGHATDMFSVENLRKRYLLDQTLTSSSFRHDMRKATTIMVDDLTPNSLFEPYRLPSIERVLQDRAPSVDSVLQTSL